MNSITDSIDQWHQTLISQGALINDETHIDFTYPATPLPTEQCFYLQNLKCIQISGDDAFSFLQGQLSCDLKEVSLQKSGIGTHNNIKGRMLSSFRIVQTSEHTYLLVLDQGIAEDCAAQLKKYAVFSKVIIELSHHLVLALHSSNIQTHFPDIQAHARYVATNISHATFMQIDSDASRFLILVESDQVASLWNQLSQNFHPSSRQIWQRQDIKDGLAWVTPLTQDRFLPQSFNYHTLGGISFKKGCYIGQEIIIRTQHQGKLKRHLCYLQIESTSSSPLTFSIGDELFRNNKAIGSVVACISGSEQAAELLAVLHQDHIHNETSMTSSQQESIRILEIHNLEKSD